MNFLTLILINISFCILVFFYKGQGTDIFCLVLALGIALTCGLYKEVAGFSTAYLLIIVLNELVFSYTSNSLAMIVGTMAYMFMGIIPLMILGITAVKTIKVNEVITVLNKLKLPQGLVIAITVAFRYAPTIKSEYRLIKDNILLRGLNPRFNILKKIEYIWVPLIMRSMKIADELTLSGILRGIEGEEVRTSYYDSSFNLIDYIVTTIITLAIIGFISIQSFL